MDTASVEVMPFTKVFMASWKTTACLTARLRCRRSTSGWLPKGWIWSAYRLRQAWYSALMGWRSSVDGQGWGLVSWYVLVVGGLEPVGWGGEGVSE